MATMRTFLLVTLVLCSVALIARAGDPSFDHVCFFPLFFFFLIVVFYVADCLNRVVVVVVVALILSLLMSFKLFEVSFVNCFSLLFLVRFT